MCGIFGHLGDPQEGQLRQMARALHHRGPDDEGIFLDAANGIGLGQTRLSIIDLSPLGHQPMHDASGRFTIVYNGEIYNYKELRHELEGRGVHFRSHSDTEVLIELLVRDGIEALGRLNGIFAFAFWDSQSRKLVLARDAFGIKPLFFVQQPTCFAFASELKALLPVLSSRTLDAMALHRYLSFLWCPGEGTPLKEVQQVRPGEALTVHDGRVVQKRIWYTLPTVRGVKPLPESPELVTGTAQAVRIAVHRQLVADVPVGAFLSGGLDSSSIVAFARELAPDIRCFSIDLSGGNDEGFADDLPYARSVASHLNVKLDVIRVDASQMASDLEKMVWMLDEPLADPAPLNVWYISKLARENGIKVLLSGAGGDDIFSGYRRHVAIRYERLWSWLPNFLQRGMGAMANGLDASNAWGRRLQRLFANAGLEGDARLAAYLAWANDSRLRPLYSDSFAAELGNERADAPMLEFLASVPSRVPPLERMLALEQRFYLTNHNLTYTDRMSMAAGVEVRVPFLDIDLVEHAARIPEHCKQRGREGKWILKAAMAPYLPSNIIYRPKTGFGAPVRRWLHNELKVLADDLLSPAALSSRGVFDPSGVSNLRRAHDSGKVDAGYTILSLMCIELWCRAFIDSGR